MQRPSGGREYVKGASRRWLCLNFKEQRVQREKWAKTDHASQFQTWVSNQVLESVLELCWLGNTASQVGCRLGVMRTEMRRLVRMCWQ